MHGLLVSGLSQISNFGAGGTFYPYPWLGKLAPLAFYISAWYLRLHSRHQLLYLPYTYQRSPNTLSNSLPPVTLFLSPRPNFDQHQPKTD